MSLRDNRIHVFDIIREGRKKGTSTLLPRRRKEERRRCHMENGKVGGRFDDRYEQRKRGGDPARNGNSGSGGTRGGEGEEARVGKSARACEKRKRRKAVERRKRREGRWAGRPVVLWRQPRTRSPLLALSSPRRHVAKQPPSSIIPFRHPDELVSFNYGGRGEEIGSRSQGRWIILHAYIYIYVYTYIYIYIYILA